MLKATCNDATKLAILNSYDQVLSLSLLEKAADDIERELQNELGGEISSTQIGELVMDKLKALDEVAYVRFASVYRQFKDINTFMEELNKLLDQKK